MSLPFKSRPVSSECCISTELCRYINIVRMKTMSWLFLFDLTSICYCGDMHAYKWWDLHAHARTRLQAYTRMGRLYHLPVWNCINVIIFINYENADWFFKFRGLTQMWPTILRIYYNKSFFRKRQHDYLVFSSYQLCTVRLFEKIPVFK